MFWNKVAWAYDIFGKVINKRTNNRLKIAVEKLIASSDKVLECACGTGLLSTVIAKRCQYLIATDFSVNMLKKAKKKCKDYDNVEFKEGSILRIEYPDEVFDVVVAANVIHLLDEPYKALSELVRVCRDGGKIIIPTYMNKNRKGTTNALVNVIGKFGAGLKRQFTLDTYKSFFEKAGYDDVEYTIIEGNIPCAIAVIRK